MKKSNSSSQGQFSANYRTLHRTLRQLCRASWQLAKVPLCLLIGCTAAFGAALVPHASPATILIVSSGVFLLAMGGATINSLQEKAVDETMPRTCRRPLVRNRVSSRYAVIQAGILMAPALVLLLSLDGSLLPPGLGGFAILMYNWVYTRLKQHTMLAIIPGAIAGGLPPIIGWIAGGGQVFTYTAMLLFVLLFLWQIPHFYLILLNHREEYLKAGQPSFLKALSEKGVRRLSGVWICGLALVMMLFSITPASVWQWQKIVLIANGLGLAALAIYALLLSETIAYRILFISLNIMFCIHMAVLALGSFQL